MEELVRRPPKKIPKLVAGNSEFLSQLEEIETAEEYCLLIEEFGRGLLLTPHQVVTLHEERRLKNFAKLRDIVIELVEQLTSYK